MSTNESLTTEQPKSYKSFKEMIDAIHKNTINSSDNDTNDDDDFDQAFEPLNNKVLYFNPLDEPTESEKNNLCWPNLICRIHSITRINFKW